MKQEQIIKEIENWNNPEFLSRINLDLNNYSQKIDTVLYERYVKQILEQSDEKLREKALKRLRKRNLIDETNSKVERNNDVVFDYNVQAINGAHDSAKDKIVFNPNGAKSFYKSYIQFSEGKRDGIRDFDYSVDIKELPNLTPTEILYWCYEHNISYEQFCKITLLHENVHKWTLRGATGFEAVMMGKDEVALIEGLVEQEARDVAHDNPDLLYLNCFRNDEVNFVGFLSKYESPKEYLLYYSANRYEINAIASFLRTKGISEEEIREKFNQILDVVTNLCEEKFSGIPNDEFEKSFYDIFLSKEKHVSDEIITTFEGYTGEDIGSGSERNRKVK